MNQILYVNAKKSDGPLELKTVMRIFAVAIIIFGILTVSKGVSGIVQNGNSITTKTTIPLLNLVQDEGKLNIIVKHDKAINRLVYNWNGGSNIVLQGRGELELKAQIDIPVGDNVLNVKILDVSGKEAMYQKQFTYTTIDSIKPSIELIVEEAKVKIVAKDNKEMAYIKYFWNEEEETIVDVRAESPKQIEEKISILKGQNTLTVIAVDAAGNEEKIEQSYIGAKRPKIDYTVEGNMLKITASAEDGIQKIELNINGVKYSTDSAETGEPLGMNEVTFKQEISRGINTVVFRVYSVNGLVSEKKNDIILE